MNPAPLSWERVLADAPWENTLGMKFVSVPGTRVLFCVWLTRVRDYSDYAAACPKIDPSWTKKINTYGLPISETPEHPVCNVSWHDAKAFCGWLCEQEQRKNVLSPVMHYRLPTDAEWSKSSWVDRRGWKNAGGEV